MPYSKVKVYSDGSHRIGIPYEPNPYVRKRRKQPEEVITVTEPAEDVSATVPDENTVGYEPAQTERENIPAVPKQRQMTRKELFEELYQKSADIRKKRERKAYVQREMLPYFKDSISCRAFVEDNFNRKHPKGIEYLLAAFQFEKGLAVYRRMGARARNGEIALSRHILCPGGCDVGKAGRSQRL